MPFEIKKINKKLYKITKPSEGKVYQMNFSTKRSAINMAKNWMSYASGRPAQVKGNIVY